MSLIGDPALPGLFPSFHKDCACGYENELDTRSYSVTDITANASVSESFRLFCRAKNFLLYTQGLLTATANSQPIPHFHFSTVASNCAGPSPNVICSGTIASLENTAKLS